MTKRRMAVIVLKRITYSLHPLETLGWRVVSGIAGIRRFEDDDDDDDDARTTITKTNKQVSVGGLVSYVSDVHYRPLPLLPHSLRVFLVDGPPHVPALVAVKDVGNVGFLDFGAGQVHPNAALVALDHWPAGERLPAVAGDQVPRVVTCGTQHKESRGVINKSHVESSRCSLR